MTDKDAAWRPSNYFVIDINDACQIRYWTVEFGVNEMQLRDSIRNVGTSSSAVRRNLKLKDNKDARWL